MTVKSYHKAICYIALHLLVPELKIETALAKEHLFYTVNS